ncbi:TPA: hypothetical protein O6C60_002872 [Staphylococcus aureus]|uniref:hypothetical protein n=1 Tax=Staphylococcus aureus TaxID=1280 RepID=UPI000E005C3A|nr:hypothetical protein [Staphylococcus aureus]MCC5241014.1 hypothetical protein [Staphylococcus aureus]MCS4661444.1 hypothetical protein [Staphylococcus aureus]MCS4661458.1 hypothetical protein [Staphylococcus aureus]MCS4722538.1 hypothetical protein [Staphylococcus aureus]MCZ4809585.1 hypothetical protein [Staphylococcus aureus]
MARITKETKTVSDGYSKEDRETTLNYDYENQEWIAYSSCSRSGRKYKCLKPIAHVKNT